MFRRAFVTALATGIGLLLAIAPAWAHEEISPRMLSTGQPTFFTLSAANEKKSNLIRVVLTAPKGVPIGATTAEPSGWQVSRTDTTVTWTAASGGGVLPDHFDQWGFETDGADQPGSFNYEIDLGYADGSHAPATVGVTVTAAAPSAPAAAASVPRASQGRANAALAAALVALLLAVVALAFALRRRATGAEGDSAQDW